MAVKFTEIKSMGTRLKISIGNPSASFNYKPAKSFTGRLIGLMDREETRAVVNTPDAARKIYTSADISIGDLSTSTVFSSGVRFVIATDDYTDLKRIVFISPIIRFTSLIHKGRIYTCCNSKEYRVEEV